MRGIVSFIVGISTTIGLVAAAVAENSRQTLLWELRSDTDVVTDKTKRRAVSQATFPDGTTVEASAECGDVGVEFAFRTFRGGEASPFAWNNDQLMLRVRVDDGAIRIATADEEYTNEAKIDFYDPDVLRRVLLSALNTSQPKLPPNNSIGAQFGKAFAGYAAEAAMSSALAKYDTVAAGTLAILYQANIVRLELPLADRSANGVEINPQDAAIRAIVETCLTTLRAPIEQEQKAANARAAAIAETKRANDAALVKKIRADNAAQRTVWNTQLDQIVTWSRAAQAIVLRQSDGFLLSKQPSGNWAWQASTLYPCSAFTVYNQLSRQQDEARWTNPFWEKIRQETAGLLSKIPPGYLRLQNGGLTLLGKKADLAPILNPARPPQCERDTASNG